MLRNEERMKGFTFACPSLLEWRSLFHVRRELMLIRKASEQRGRQHSLACGEEGKKVLSPTPQETCSVGPTGRGELWVNGSSMMFDARWSDENRDEAEKQSRVASKDFYPPLLLKCRWALWSRSSSLCPCGLGQQATQGSEGESQPTRANSPGPLLWLSLWCARGRLQTALQSSSHTHTSLHTIVETHLHNSVLCYTRGNMLNNLLYRLWPPERSECFNTERVIFILFIDFWIQREEELQFWRISSHFSCSPVSLSLCPSLPESNITIALSINSSEVLEGDAIQLTCSVQSTTGPLSVVWHWTDKQANVPPEEVASVDRDGTVWHSPAYRERSSYGEIHVEKMRADTFLLSLYNALPGDEGQYRCVATEWFQTGTEPELTWEKIGEKSATKTVSVKTVGKLFQPHLATILCVLSSPSQ